MQAPEILKEAFVRNFSGEGKIREFFSPGRVNLIGEYTDFNGGHVFPCAIDRGTYCAVRKRRDDVIRFYSVNEKGAGVLQASLSMADQYHAELAWANYAMGMIWALRTKGYVIDRGFDMAVYGDIPVGAGLSSSASLEVLTGYMLKKLFDLDVSGKEIALLGQLDENKFIGVNCGIMDQFVIAMGEKGCAVFLNTDTLDYQAVPVELQGMDLLVINTNKPRGLRESKYNERRRECEQALEDLQKVTGIRTLCELSTEEFEKYAGAILDPLCRKRARHAVSENQRTLEAVEVLRRGDIGAFGKLMNQSHVSLRDDFEVSGKELDVIARTAWSCPGVAGARMTGAGFGGCAVAIVRQQDREETQRRIQEEYTKEIGYAPSFYPVRIEGGPREL